jgi:hypothetical protein
VVQREGQCLLDPVDSLQGVSQCSFEMDTRTSTPRDHAIENESVNDDGILELMLFWLKNLFLMRECPRKIYVLGPWPTR